jgi:excisionase family DNA binding protein
LKKEFKREIKIDPLLGIEQVASLLGVHKNTVRQLIEDGELKAYRIKSVVRISGTSVLDYLERNRLNPSPLAAEDPEE